MYKRWLFTIIAIEILLTVNVTETHGFGSNYTHPTITRLALKDIVKEGQIDRYLKDELEMKDGIDSPLSFYPNIDDVVPYGEIERNNDVLGENLRRQYPTRFGKPYTAGYLMISGSEAEDHPTERAQHHFHDPISDIGLNNNYYGIGILADFFALFYPSAEQGNVGRFFCSLLALCEPSFNLDGTSAVDRIKGETSSSYPYNYFAWPDTRRYFYNALTSKTREEREHYSALTFFSLGHSLHILEDMGVPAHTRNDFMYDHIWHGIIKGSYLEGYLESGRVVEKIPVVKTDISFSRFTDFWDNNRTQGLSGMAEYTNHNFLSEGTIFKNYRDPDWLSVETYEEMAEDGQKDFVQYYTGRTSDGVDIPHLATVGLLHSAFAFLGDKDRARYTAFLDPYCYRDYSEILIPKTISYVSGLIDYFFRGRIAVIKDGIKDGLAGFSIKNISDEPIAGGNFEVYYDSTSGLRNRLASYALTPPSSDIPLMPGKMTDKITFEVPVDNTTPGRYIFVFKGRLGEEDNAVTGKIIRDKIYFVSERRGVPEIYSMNAAMNAAMNADSSDIKLLLSNSDPVITYTHPAVSNDGTKLAFHSNRDGGEAIWIYDIPAGNLKRLTSGVWPDWSPDGKRLVYYKNTGGKNDIFIIDVESLLENRLTDDSYNNLWPAWSPDGAKIAFTSQRESKADIVVIGIDDKNLQNLTAQNLTASIDNLDRWKPAWSPDGRKIAYEKPTKIVYSPGEPLYVNIHILEMDTGKEINLTGVDSSNKDYGVWNGTPRWMDNVEIIIESNVSGESWSDLWIIDARNGGFIKRLTDTPGHDGYPFVW